MNISIIGSGNVATQFGKVFLKTGHTIVQVISSNVRSGKQLASRLKTSFSSTYADPNNQTDIFLIAVKDAQITEVVKSLIKTGKIVVHTSGSIDINVFKNKFRNYGVFYPLQTIKINRAVNFKKVPICLEASNEKTEEQLFKLADTISGNIYMLSSEQRLKVHLAAVFANNFTNHLYALAEKILNQNDLSFDLIRPLIEQTAKNSLRNSPATLQTGPAMRNDKITINKHLKLLEKDKELQKIYKLMTESIYKLNKK